MTAVLLAALVVAGLLLIMVMLVRPSTGLSKQYFEHYWRPIVKAAQGTPAEQRIAVINADKLLDEAMKQLRIPGGNMGDRLRAAKGRFRYVDNVWYAHKLRNRIVHESSDSLETRELKTALRYFERALKDLGAL